MKYKIILSLFITIVLYVLLSLFVYGGEFSPVHYYSYNSLKECKEKSTFASNDLEMKIEGDSLKLIKNLNRKFYSCKSMYEKFYGILIHIDGEDIESRRIQWEEPLSETIKRNWIIKVNGEYQGEAFYAGSFDAKIGETILLEIQNKKTDYKIGKIKIKVK